MCWSKPMTVKQIKDKRTSPAFKIAKRNKTVYKKLSVIDSQTGEADIYSDHRYTVDELQKRVKLEVQRAGLYFHIYEGYHSCSKKNNVMTCNARFVIPKGTKYYIHSRGEIVSETIIFKGWLR